MTRLLSLCLRDYLAERELASAPTASRSEKLLATYVVRLGLEPRLFWTKTRRVASYTTGQSINTILQSYTEFLKRKSSLRTLSVVLYAIECFV